MTLSNKYNEVMNKIEVTEEMRSRILQNIANEFSEDNQTTGETPAETKVETPIDFAKRAQDRKKSVYSFTRYIGVAAAAVVLLIGASAVFDNGKSESSPVSNFTETAHEYTQGAAADLHKESEFIKNSWVKYESVEKMAQATGSAFTEIEYLNGISSDTDYYLDGGDTATIVYDVSGNAITITQRQEVEMESQTTEAAVNEAPAVTADMAEPSGTSSKLGISKGSKDTSKSDAPVKVSETITVNGVDGKLEGTEDGFNKSTWTVDGIDYSMDSAEKLSLDDMEELMKNILR